MDSDSTRIRMRGDDLHMTTRRQLLTTLAAAPAGLALTGCGYHAHTRSSLDRVTYVTALGSSAERDTTDRSGNQRRTNQHHNARPGASIDCGTQPAVGGQWRIPSGGQISPH